MRGDDRTPVYVTSVAAELAEHEGIAELVDEWWPILDPDAVLAELFTDAGPGTRSVSLTFDDNTLLPLLLASMVVLTPAAPVASAQETEADADGDDPGDENYAPTLFSYKKKRTEDDFDREQRRLDRETIRVSMN